MNLPQLSEIPFKKMNVYTNKKCIRKKSKKDREERERAKKMEEQQKQEASTLTVTGWSFSIKRAPFLQLHSVGDKS